LNQKELELKKWEILKLMDKKLDEILKKLKIEEEEIEQSDEPTKEVL
jgi:hypothetical protein